MIPKEYPSRRIVLSSTLENIIVFVANCVSNRKPGISTDSAEGAFLDPAVPSPTIVLTKPTTHDATSL